MRCSSCVRVLKAARCVGAPSAPSHYLCSCPRRLTHAQSRAIADAPFPVTLLGGRHDPVAPVKWLQLAAARMRGTLVVTGSLVAYLHGLQFELCLLMKLEPQRRHLADGVCRVSAG